MLKEKQKNVNSISDEKKFKYEVAFSFLKEDENTAIDIDNIIKDRISTFCYPIKEKEVFGNDGVEKLSKIFRSESRCVVILYREGWGEAGWSKIEKTAITSRIYDEKGYDFLRLIVLDKTAVVPEWVPSSIIWSNFQENSIEKTASVIEDTIKKIGGKIRVETAVDMGERLGRKVSNERDRKTYLGSTEGYDAARREKEELFEIIGKNVMKLSENMQPKVDKVSKTIFSISVMNFRMVLLWQEDPFCNVLNNVSFVCRYINKDEITIKEFKLEFTLSSSGENGWCIDSLDGFFNTEDLATYLLKILYKYVEDEID